MVLDVVAPQLETGPVERPDEQPTPHVATILPSVRPEMGTRQKPAVGLVADPREKCISNDHGHDPDEKNQASAPGPKGPHPRGDARGDGRECHGGCWVSAEGVQSGCGRRHEPEERFAKLARYLRVVRGADDEGE